MTTVRYSAHILVSASFLLVGFPDQVLRIMDQPIAANLALGVVAALIFTLHLFGKNPLDKLIK